ALASTARKAGFKGELHLSTLGNCSFEAGLPAARKAGFSKVVLPRELTIDEIKQMAAGAPEDLDLEVFVHGALCYGVSGRCYWSSWFGGKSGLRGRCVQPCRRVYSQGGREKRFFSCLDFSVDVLAKLLTDLDGISAWKIEGRKKGPHYVYYTVKAYQLLRDSGTCPESKKQALSFLEYAMGRPAVHYNFLSHRRISPVSHDGNTGSGLFAGRINNPSAPSFVTREALLKGDLLRIGYEDEAGHKVQRVTRPVPKKGTFFLNKSAKGKVKKGSAVFIVDRREGVLGDLIKSLSKELDRYRKVEIRLVKETKPAGGKTRPRKIGQGRKTIVDLKLKRNVGKKVVFHSDIGLWLNARDVKLPAKVVKKVWWWLPPVLFPEGEAELKGALKTALNKGATRFVANIPWQRGLFEDLKKISLWAGPFCNTANVSTLHFLKKNGFSGCIVSPELDKGTFIQLPENSPIPLGAVILGNWPLAVSRIIPEEIDRDLPFMSPMKEGAWISRQDGNVWVFPDWQIDLRSKKKELKEAGYSMFVSIFEPVPKQVHIKKRQGLWNWDLDLL
ncbi:MAG: peptidase U32 family protein, partial [Thermodesulfobacteriota bacterium]